MKDKHKIKDKKEKVAKKPLQVLPKKEKEYLEDDLNIPKPLSEELDELLKKDPNRLLGCGG